MYHNNSSTFFISMTNHFQEVIQQLYEQNAVLHFTVKLVDLVFCFTGEEGRDVSSNPTRGCYLSIRDWKKPIVRIPTNHIIIAHESPKTGFITSNSLLIPMLMCYWGFSMSQLGIGFNMVVVCSGEY